MRANEVSGPEILILSGAGERESNSLRETISCLKATNSWGERWRGEDWGPAQISLRGADFNYNLSAEFNFSRPVIMTRTLSLVVVVVVVEKVTLLARTYNVTTTILVFRFIILWKKTTTLIIIGLVSHCHRATVWYFPWQWWEVTASLF